MTESRPPAPLQAVKGMNDILPPESARWEWLEDTIRSLMRRYGYAGIRTPIVEPTQLFVRGLGEVTDIVEKEMYSFVDSMNGDRLTLQAGEHRRRGARRHRARAAARRRPAPLLHRPDVPPRAAAEGPLPAVPPVRRRGDGLRRPRRRRRADPDVPRALARARPGRGPRRAARAQQPRPARRAPRPPRGDRGPLRGPRRRARRRLAPPPAQQPAAHPRQQEPGDAGADRGRAAAARLPRRGLAGPPARGARRARRRRPRPTASTRAWCAASTTTT